MTIYYVGGNVMNKKTQDGVSGLRVEAWVKVPASDKLLGNDVTDLKGSFSIKFDAGNFQELNFDSKQDVNIKVFRGKQLLTTKKSSVLWNKNKVEKLITLFVDEDSDNNPPSGNQPDENTNGFVPLENINAVAEAVRMVWPDSEQQQKRLEVIKSLECVASPLGLLWNDARDFLQGNTPAGNRLLAQLNTLALHTTPSLTNFSDSEPHMQPISGDAGFIPNPFLPGSRYPCLFPPLRLTDIYFGIGRLVELIPNAPAEMRDRYFVQVESLVEKLVPFEMIHLAARRVLEGEPGAREYFIASTKCIGEGSGAGNRQPIAMSSGNFSVPGNQPPFMIFDPCRAERWQETADAVNCFRRLQAAPRYVIDDIFNLTKGVSRRGCVDDEIEIRGNNLGSRGHITFGRGIEATTLSWTDNSIRFSIPADAHGDELGICIDPNIDSCVRFPRVCRLPADATDHSFEFVPAPTIGSFSLSGPAIRSTGTDQYEAEACTEITLNAIAQNAEQVIIHDSTGTTIWDSGVDVPRTINTGELDSPLVLNGLQTDLTITLEVRNLCGNISQTFELSIYKAIHLTAGDRVRVGDSIALTIRISCPAPDGGTPVTLSDSLPAAFILPDDAVVIGTGETTTTIDLVTGSGCAEAEISASSPDYRGDSVIILVYDTPVIDEITPLVQSACSTFTLEIQGNCFDPEAAGNSVRATNGTETILLSVISIRFLDPANRGHNAVLEVQGVNLLPGSWELFVESHGLTSARFADPIVIRPVPAIVHNFSNNPLRITPCIDNSVELRWEVSRAERVEISAGGGSVISRTYGPACMRRSDSARVTVREATTFQLSAFPIGGGVSATSSLRIEEISVVQAEEVRVENWTRGRYFPEHTLTIWQQDLTTGERINRETIRNGEGVTIELTPCHLHQIFAVSHEWIEEHNRIHRTTFSPGDSSIVDYPQFHKLTIPDTSRVPGILGRNAAGRLSYRIEPGG